MVCFPSPTIIPVGTPRSVPQWGHIGEFDSFAERRVVSLICARPRGPKLYRIFGEESISARFYIEMQIRTRQDDDRPRKDKYFDRNGFRSATGIFHLNAYPIRAYSERPFIPNGECRGNVSIPLNELTVELRSGNTLKRFCAPIANR
jgi:hypothetical protein